MRTGTPWWDKKSSGFPYLMHEVQAAAAATASVAFWEKRGGSLDTM